MNPFAVCPPLPPSVLARTAWRLSPPGSFHYITLFFVLHLHYNIASFFPFIACVRQLLSATWYMHQQGIVHRDLKLENVVYETKKPDSDIFIIDYGLSKVEGGLRRFACCVFMMFCVLSLHDTMNSFCGRFFAFSPSMFSSA